MTSMYDPFNRVVLNMVTKYGGYSTLNVASAGSYDATTSRVVETNVQYQIRTLKFDYIPKKDGETTMPNTLIRSGDKQLFVLPSTAPIPNPKTDEVIYQGVRHSIITVKELNPSGSNLMLIELFIRE